MSAALESLLCQHCGASLRVGPGAEYVTCAHCGTPLRVRRSESAAWTELTERTDRIEAKVDRLDRRTELAELDRQWDRTRESLMLRGQHGAKYEPSMGKGVWAGIVGVGGALFAGAMLGSSNAPGFLKVGFPLLFAGFGLFAAFRNLANVERWRTEERNYRRRRAELEGETDAG